MKNKYFFLSFLLLISLLAFTGCNNAAPRAELSSELAVYRNVIERNQKLFEITFAEDFSDIAQAEMLRVNIENISDITYSWFKLNLVFTDTSGNLIEEFETGIYSHLSPQDTISVFINPNAKIARGYVINVANNLF